MITSPTSHFTDANDMASTSHEPQKTTNTIKLKLCPMMKWRKDEVTNQGKGEWSRCVIWEKTYVMTGQNKDMLTGSMGESDQWIYRGWRIYTVNGRECGRRS